MSRSWVLTHRAARAVRLLAFALVAGGALCLGSQASGQSPPAGRLDPRLEQVADGDIPPAAVDGVDAGDGAVKIIIEAYAADESQAADAAAALGRVQGRHGSLIQAEVPISSLRGLARSPGVALVRPPLHVYTSAITGEGVALTNADDWQTAGLTGAGVKVAVLDLGFQGYEAQLGNELPSTVTAMSFVSGGDIHGGGETHGTGVAEVVHEMAPDADLYLANFSTEVELAAAADWLAAQGVRVINASWGYFTSGPGDGTGIVDQIISDSVASGVFWSVAAGNAAARHWRGVFTDTDGNGFNEFAQSPFDEGNQVTGSFLGLALPGEKIVAELKWNDPFGAACRDYDLYLERTDNNGNPLIVAASQNVQNDGSQCIPGADPVEAIDFTVSVADTYHLVIKKIVAPTDATFDLYSAYQDLEYVTPSGSLIQPADNPDVTTVAAVPYYAPTTIEPFSSLGPTTDGRIKPDIAAPDGVSNATFGNFFGTSAAAPHITGAAALVLSSLPCLTPAQTGEMLQSNVSDLGVAGKDTTFGAGLLLFGATPPDRDADLIGDECDNCPLMPNHDQVNQDGDEYGDTCEQPQCVTVVNHWSVPAGDSDCDGYPDSISVGVRGAEALIGTDPAAKCAATSAPDDEPLPDAWPVDFDDNQVVTLSDVTRLASVFGSSAPGPPYLPRLDMNADGKITLVDVTNFVPLFGKHCAP